MLSTCVSSCCGVFGQPQEMMSQPATTFIRWRQRGGGAVHVVAVTDECGVGRGGGWPRGEGWTWRQDRVGGAAHDGCVRGEMATAARKE
jgi:hypothetical protein